MSTADAELTVAHAAYLDGWNRGLQTGDPEPAIRYLHPTLRSFFFNPGMDAPSDGDHATYAESVRAAAVYLGPEARWTAEDCLAVQRGADRGTVACRVWLHRPGRAPHPMLTLSAWRRDGELWQMCRIYEEVGVPERPADDAVLAAHADSVQTWDACLRSGDPAPALAVQSPELRAVFGNAQMEAPRQMDAAAYGQACTAVVTNRHGDGWRTLARIGEARSADEGMVLSHDLALDKGRSFDVFSLGVWRRTAGGWRLIRIYEEA